MSHANSFFTTVSGPMRPLHIKRLFHETSTGFTYTSNTSELLQQLLAQMNDQTSVLNELVGTVTGKGAGSALGNVLGGAAFGGSTLGGLANAAHGGISWQSILKDVFPVGGLIAGIANLFGSAPTPPPLSQYDAPPTLNFDAVLNKDGTFSQGSTDQFGFTRSALEGLSFTDAQGGPYSPYTRASNGSLVPIAGDPVTKYSGTVNLPDLVQIADVRNTGAQNTEAQNTEAQNHESKITGEQGGASRNTVSQNVAGIASESTGRIVPTAVGSDLAELRKTAIEQASEITATHSPSELTGTQIEEVAARSRATLDGEQQGEQTDARSVDSRFSGNNKQLAPGVQSISRTLQALFAGSTFPGGVNVGRFLQGQAELAPNGEIGSYQQSFGVNASVSQLLKSVITDSVGKLETSASDPGPGSNLQNSSSQTRTSNSPSGEIRDIGTGTVASSTNTTLTADGSKTLPSFDQQWFNDHGSLIASAVRTQLLDFHPIVDAINNL